MPKLKIFVGPPGSGKSTAAKAFTDHIYINQDSQGKEGHLYRFNNAVLNGKDIIVDRMNFNKSQRNTYIQAGKEFGYEIEIHIFYKPRAKCIADCTTRVGHETIKDADTANKAVNFFFSKYERPTPDEGTIFHHGQEPGLGRFPEAIIVDLDGTLCNINHRLHHVRGPGKKNWPAFFAGISEDKANMWCFNFIYSMSSAYRIVFCSGRGEEYRKSTTHWLHERGLDGFPLFMRSAGDSRPDDLVKENILDFDILTQYRPFFFIDDRKRVVDMWRRRGYTCLQCAEGDF